MSKEKKLSPLEEQALTVRARLLNEALDDCVEQLVTFIARYPDKDSYTAWLDAPASFSDDLVSAASSLAEPSFRVKVRPTNTGLSVSVERKH